MSQYARYSALALIVLITLSATVSYMGGVMLDWQVGYVSLAGLALIALGLHDLLHEFMELHIRGNHPRHRATCDRLASGLDLQSPLTQRAFRIGLGRAPGRQAFDHCAHVVHVLHMIRVQRGNDQPAPRRILQHPLVAEQHQCLLHRLPGHPQRLGDLLLDDAFTRHQLSGRDLVEQGVMHLFDQIGSDGQRFHDARTF